MSSSNIQLSDYHLQCQNINYSGGYQSQISPQSDMEAFENWGTLPENSATIFNRTINNNNLVSSFICILQCTPYHICPQSILDDPSTGSSFHLRDSSVKDQLNIAIWKILELLTTYQILQYMLYNYVYTWVIWLILTIEQHLIIYSRMSAWASDLLLSRNHIHHAPISLCPFQLTSQKNPKVTILKSNFGTRLTGPSTRRWKSQNPQTHFGGWAWWYYGHVHQGWMWSSHEQCNLERD